ncbi:response regulator transcription factor [Pelagicoccus sp. SDUM812002]|uniref:response regulator transcription factor n=1 Tax=Pelagicoccus sp. SDUM812002 TaxID=3041266 RepID=UPI00280D2F6F|nr:response regulator transcription factor [Pelagicoccus sp. SDUM812002]MDQ8187595.1 response regulator transcription factor [Pelagicoccus sp. SDUM812002]
MKAYKVGIVDDHPFVARGLEAMFALDGGLVTAWAALDYDEAAERLLSSPVDIVVVDIKMGDAATGLRVLERVAELGGKTAAVVLSAYAPARLVRAAHELGARGFFSKNQDGESLIAALKEICSKKGNAFYGPYAEYARPNLYLDISSREREVMVLIAKGKSNSEVARELGLKVGTVKTHLESIYKKLGATNRTEAMRVGLAEGHFYLEELL